MDARVDVGTEQVPFTRDFLLSSAMKGGLSTSNLPALGGFLYYRGMIMADLGYDADVFKPGKGIVY